MSSCDPFVVQDNKPEVKLPPLPRNVYSKRTILPDNVNTLSGEEREKANKRLLLEYEKNEQHNIRAIDTAKKDRVFINKTYQGKGG